MSNAASRNPYVRGNYRLAFALMQRKQVFTRSQIVSFLQEQGLKEPAAVATATVLLSPREKNSKRGDCRGNFSAMGHLYFVKPTAKATGEEKKFRLCYRAKALGRRTYNRELKKIEVRQVKSAKTPAKKAAKVLATAS